jgi:hypothetical protein
VADASNYKQPEPESELEKKNSPFTLLVKKGFLNQIEKIIL